MTGGPDLARRLFCARVQGPVLIHKPARRASPVLPSPQKVQMNEKAADLTLKIADPQIKITLNHTSMKFFILKAKIIFSKTNIQLALIPKLKLK